MEPIRRRRTFSTSDLLNIKYLFLLSCSHTFNMEVAGWSCTNIKSIHQWFLSTLAVYCRPRKTKGSENIRGIPSYQEANRVLILLKSGGDDKNIRQHRENELPFFGRNASPRKMTEALVDRKKARIDCSWRNGVPLLPPNCFDNFE